MNLLLTEVFSYPGLDSVNLVQFKKAFRGNLSDMLVITEACVEKNTQVLNDRHRCYFLVKKCYTE